MPAPTEFLKLCHVCADNETNSQIKAGCGHLVRICDECRGEQRKVQHEGCGRKECGGHSHASERLEREEDEQHLSDYYDRYDPLFDYDPSWEDERLGPPLDEYDYRPQSEYDYVDDY